MSDEMVLRVIEIDVDGILNVEVDTNPETAGWPDLWIGALQAEVASGAISGEVEFGSFFEFDDSPDQPLAEKTNPK
jgi:hypothetical protein